MIEKLIGLSDKVKLFAALGFAAACLIGCVAIVLPMRGELKATERQLSSTQSDLAVTTKDLATCKSNRLSLESGIQAANQIVEQQRQAAEIAAAEGNRKLQAALRLAQTYKNRAQKIAQAKPSSPDQCVAAQSLIVQTLGEERQ